MVQPYTKDNVNDESNVHQTSREKLYINKGFD